MSVVLNVVLMWSRISSNNVFLSDLQPRYSMASMCSKRLFSYSLFGKYSILECFAQQLVSRYVSAGYQGYDFTWGRILHFVIAYWMVLTTVQRYCASCDLSQSGGNLVLVILNLTARYLFYESVKVCSLWLCSMSWRPVQMSQHRPLYPSIKSMWRLL